MRQRDVLSQAPLPLAGGNGASLFFACPKITSALVFRALGALTRHALFLCLRALISAEHFLQCETNLTRVQAQVGFHVFITNQRGEGCGFAGAWREHSLIVSGARNNLLTRSAQMSP